jgi:two-component system, chemotaxis family, protein-glutamate methylesterase/glutaminase
LGASARILIADDSAVVRHVVRDLLESAGIIVAGEAKDGREAVDLARRLSPDLVILDIMMPHVSGVEAVTHIMDEAPTRVLILSNLARNDDVGLCLDALRAGALDVMAKPVALSASVPKDFEKDLLGRVRLLCGMRVPQVARSRNRTPIEAVPAVVPFQPLETLLPIRCIAIGASTGGPRVLAQLLRELPKDLPSGLLIVQHIAQGFEQGLAEWLNATSSISVRLAQPGDRVEPARALLAPTGKHLVMRHGVLALVDEPPMHGCRPSADLLFRSVAYTFRSGAIGVVLSGMGVDGADGARVMKERGAEILVQSEDSCAIWGMPRATFELGVADKAVHPDQLAKEIVKRVQQRKRGPLV